MPTRKKHQKEEFGVEEYDRSTDQEVSANMVLDNLKKLVGRGFDEAEVVRAFEGFKEEGEARVRVEDGNGRGFDKVARVDSANGTRFRFRLGRDGGIEEVWMI